MRCGAILWLKALEIEPPFPPSYTATCFMALDACATCPGFVNILDSVQAWECAQALRKVILFIYWR